VLERFNVKGLSIKWPNDVYVFDKKICGILLEGCSTDNQITDIIIGIGINVNQTEFSGEYNVPPTSMAIELNKKTNLSKLKRKIYKHFII
jgi:BirA family biotin operon repressor/biotin-[acetyl-CoA-carboxylase] ligase